MSLAPQEIHTFFVTAITWQRRSLFRAAPMAELFLDTLFRYRTQGKFLSYEFVLMPDNFHLLLTPAHEVSLEKAMQLVKEGFSFRVKREMASSLEIWQAGFTEHRIPDWQDFQHHATYIRENPVRAHLAESSSGYPSSFAAQGFEMDPAPPWLKPQTIMTPISPG
ncbi:MAG: transposase [Acidobacteriota bacterium]|nr:transposase [Acidobacteriota bacterium]